MTDLQSILLHKIQNRENAHFYILRPTNIFLNTKQYLDNWIKALLIKVIKFHASELDNKTIENKYLQGHPDITLIYPGENKDNYLLENFTPFFKALNYNCYELKTKFIVVFDSHLIKSNSIHNKLLKSLEEPTENTIIIFINPTLTKFIQTIESRAISLRVGKSSEISITNQNLSLSSWLDVSFSLLRQNETEKDNLLELKNLIISYSKSKITINEIISYVTNDKYLERYFVKLALEWSNHKDNFREKDLLLKESIWYERSSKFHNSKFERLIKFALSFKEEPMILTIESNS